MAVLITLLWIGVMSLAVAYFDLRLTLDIQRADAKRLSTEIATLQHAYKGFLNYYFSPTRNPRNKHLEDVTARISRLEKSTRNRKKEVR